MKLEDRLRRVLKREQPPADFAERVSARIESPGLLRPSRSTTSSIARRRLAGLVTAATIAIVSGASLYYGHQRQIAEAERVRNEAAVGLRIASAKLNEVHDRLFRRITDQNERPR